MVACCVDAALVLNAAPTRAFAVVRNFSLPVPDALADRAVDLKKAALFAMLWSAPTRSVLCPAMATRSVRRYSHRCELSRAGKRSHSMPATLRRRLRRPLSTRANRATRPIASTYSDRAGDVVASSATCRPLPGTRPRAALAMRPSSTGCSAKEKIEPPPPWPIPSRAARRSSRRWKPFAATSISAAPSRVRRAGARPPVFLAAGTVETVLALDRCSIARALDDGQDWPLRPAAARCRGDRARALVSIAVRPALRATCKID